MFIIMPTAFSFFEIFIIIGISQGLVTSILLLTSKENQLSKRILGVTILVFCSANLKVILHTSGLWDQQYFRYFPVGMELLLPPLVYFYVLSLTETQFELKKQHLWHFVIGLSYASYDILVYLLALGEDTMAAKRQVAAQLYFDQSNLIEDYLIVILTIGYIGFGGKKIVDYLAWLKQFKQYKSFPIYRWLRSLIIWSSILGSVLMINQLLTAFSIAMDEPMYRWRFFNLFLAFVTYYLGFMGYKNDGLKVHLSQTSLSTLAKKLSQKQIQAIEAALIKKLEQDAVYLNGSLTIKQLASQLGVTSENLSLVVNHKFEMGFRDLLNSYRVNRVKKCLADSSNTKSNNSNSSMLDIALESGFNSQASFYRAFKKHEGISPKAFMESLS
jgi:AraC-like DNA-binding protein